LQNDPNNGVLLQQLLQITHGSDASAEQARQRLRELIAQRPSAVLHLALGLDAYAEGKPEQARFHWEQAVSEDREHMLVAANNVAWLLSHPQPGDQKALKLATGAQAMLLPATAEPANLNRALELIVFVVKQRPTNPRFRETRGQILLKMGRWKESIADLEYALPAPVPANKGPIHASLARAYQELGLPELAEQHRKLAQIVKP
jgi:tetratricopeptide (TPR) repeat protein